MSDNKPTDGFDRGSLRAELLNAKIKNERLHRLVFEYFKEHQKQNGGFCDCPTCNFVALEGFDKSPLCLTGG